MFKENSLRNRRELNFRAIKETLRLWLYLRKYILHYKKQELGLLFLGTITLALALINPYLGKIIMDQGILGKDPVIFIKCTVLAGIIFLLKLAIDNASNYLRSFTTRKMRVDLYRLVFKKIAQFPLRFFQSSPSSEYIFSVNSDIGNSSNILTSALPDVFLILLKITALTLIIFLIDFRAMFLVLLYQILVILRFKFFSKKEEDLLRATIIKSQEMFKVLGNLFSHIYFLKASGTVIFTIRKFFRKFSEIVTLETKDTNLKLSSGIFSSLSDKIFFGLVGFLMTLLVIKNKLTLGNLTAMMMYLTQGTQAYSALLNSSRQIVSQRVYLERLIKLLSFEVEIKERPQAKYADLAKAKIEFQRVVFGYEKNKSVFEDLSFLIPPQAKISLVGHSGCGKTTLLNLILRLYDTNEGKILLGDDDIRDLRFKSLYHQIGLVPQEPFLFNDSVINNIMYGRDKYSLEEAIFAAKISQAHEFILDLPDGYQSVIGENAGKISQGQKQRIAIARTLVRYPKILLLDEAMSALDSETEDKIIEGILREFEHTLVVLVSHRLSAVKKMEQVYFLKNPSLMQIDSHQRLLENDPAYYALFSSQIEAEKTSPEADFICQ